MQILFSIDEHSGFLKCSLKKIDWIIQIYGIIFFPKHTKKNMGEPNTKEKIMKLLIVVFTYSWGVWSEDMNSYPKAFA